MPVTAVHPDYTRRVPQWERIADCLEGTDAIKAGREKYLPMLAGHRQDTTGLAYTNYLKRAVWYGATARVRDALVGAVFQDDPEFEVPTALEDRLNNLDNEGSDRVRFSKRLFDLRLSFGCYGMLVDVSEGPTRGTPWIAIYEPMAIRNWRWHRDETGARIIDQVVLAEQETRRTDDGFGDETVDVYRELALDDQGYYYQQMHRRRDGTNATDFVPDGQPVYPRRRGLPLDFIPFVFDSDLPKSPILDMVDINIAWYVNSADIEHGAFKTAHATPWIVGLNKDARKEWHIGGDNVWILPSGCQVGLLEPTGSGLGQIEARMRHKEEMLAHLGARLLADEKRGVEAAETARIRAAGENSTLAGLARACADDIEKALRWVAEWAGANPDDVKVEFNTEFYDPYLTAGDLASLISAVQHNLLPIEAFLWNLQKGELLPPDMTPEDAKRLLDERAQTLLGPPLDLDGEEEPGEGEPGDEREDEEADDAAPNRRGGLRSAPGRVRRG